MEYVDSWLLTNVWMWWWEAESCQPPPSQCWMLECKVCIVSRCGNFTKIGWAEEWVEEGWEQCTMADGITRKLVAQHLQRRLHWTATEKSKSTEMKTVTIQGTMLVTSSSKLQHTHSALAQQWWLAAKWRVWQSTPRYSTCWVPPWQCSTQISTLETCPNTALSVNPAIKYIKCILAAFAIGFWISSEVICSTVNNASCRLSLKIQLGAKVFREDKHLAMIDGCSVARTYPLLTDGAGAGSYRCAVQDTDTHLGQCSAMCSADTTTTRPLLSANTN